MISGISTDTRKIGENALFLALRGENFDGHDYVAGLPDKGVRGAIVEELRERESFPANFALIQVADTLTAYQRIAAQYRRTLPLKLIAITGSNGKTSTKDLTAALLSGQHRVLKTAGNLNNHVGVPQTLLQASRTDQVVVLEIGMNHPGEIAPLAAAAKPDVAIITNIGTAHIEYMKTRAAIAQEKGVLAESVDQTGYVILPAEDDYSPEIGRRTAATKVLVGFTRGEIRAEHLRLDERGTRFALVADDGSRRETFVPVAGKHMVLNSLLAIAAARVLDVPWDECVAALASARLTKGRLERKVAGGLNILDDTYNANPDSVVAALETLAQLPTEGRRIAVLGKMGELGDESEAGHLRVGAAAAREGLDQLLAVGEEGKMIARGASDHGGIEIEAFPSVTEAAEWLRAHAEPTDTILIKGSRSAGMERIVALLDAQQSVPAHALS